MYKLAPLNVLNTHILSVFSKAIHALAKVGDDMYIEARKEKLTLITLNLRKTICVRYHLLDSFFSSYELNEGELNEQCEAITCKIHMKTLIPLIKGAHLEKKVSTILNTCTILHVMLFFS